MHLRYVTLAILACTIVAFAQTPNTVDSPFLVRYAANLNVGESYINMINTNADNDEYTINRLTNICVNVYAFDPNANLLACCTCLLTPNSVQHMAVVGDILANVSGVLPTSVVVKLLATLPNITKTTCGGAATANSQTLTNGLLAYGTTLHQGPTGVFGTETAFGPATLTDADFRLMTNSCAAISKTSNGICGTCKLGAQ